MGVFTIRAGKFFITGPVYYEAFLDKLIKSFLSMIPPLVKTLEYGVLKHQILDTKHGNCNMELGMAVTYWGF